MNTAIHLDNISKIYKRYSHGIDRLREIITHHPCHQAFTALHPMNLTILKGQVIGIVGKNGAGKSTLLKLVAGTLHPDQGHCHVMGRVAALLELGGGFHPEMSGRENVYLNGAMMGLDTKDIDDLYDEIVAFAEISEFMEQPVKTYSSGMFMRLAFAVATCVEPDVLIVDEALSVGDGAFARKSFNRFMQFKENGKTILFCSHATYQVEAICDRVIWLDKGQIRLDGDPSGVISAYNDFLAQQDALKIAQPTETASLPTTPTPITPQGTAQIKNIVVEVDGIIGQTLEALSLQSHVRIQVDFIADVNLPTPTVGIVILGADGKIVTSAGSKNDNVIVQCNEYGQGSINLHFEKFGLLKGEYWIDVYLLCEKAIHVYEEARNVAKIKVNQQSLELGIASLPHYWE